MLLVSLSVTSLAWALHTVLVKATPAVDGTVKAAPTDLTLWFNERPDLSLSNIRLRGPDSALVELGAVKAGTDSTALAAPVRGTLKPGKYTVLYRTAGDDGHVMRGSYSFTFQP
ncbi:MAG TPA: copper resistance CopC family protein [Gemmatimonadales bacterium]|nr:copper resistance CopC family protein [Gemmatimonadales bacterium]